MPGADTFGGPADVYDRFVGRYGASLASALTAGARPGMRALDVGCGPGALAAVLADRLGGSSVAAVDPSPQFVKACRERLPDVDVREGPAEALPFEDGSFDVTYSQLVLNFLTDPEGGMREMARVTRPGGTVAACVWDYGGEMTLLRAFWDAALEIEPERAAAADEGVVMPLCAEGELAGLWDAVGLRSIRSGPLTASASYDDFDDLWAPLPTGVGPAGAFCQSLPDSEQAALRDALRRRLGVGDAPFELTARAWAVAGQVGG